MYIQGIRAIDAIRTSTNVYRRRVRMGASARTWRTIMNVLVWRVSKVSAAIIFNLFTIDWYLLGFNGFLFVSGKDCSININECEKNPCAAGSTCVDGIASYTCVCQDGLTGPNCETDIDDCQVN